MYTSIAALAAAEPGKAFGIDLGTVLAIFTGVVLVLGGIVIGSVMVFRANRAQTSDNARTLLNVGMGLFVVFLLVGGAGWYFVNSVGNAVIQSK